MEKKLFSANYQCFLSRIFKRIFGRLRQEFEFRLARNSFVLFSFAVQIKKLRGNFFSMCLFKSAKM